MIFALFLLPLFKSAVTRTCEEHGGRDYLCCPGFDSPAGGAHCPQTGPLRQPETESGTTVWATRAVPLQSAGKDWLEARGRSAKDKTLKRQKMKSQTLHVMAELSCLNALKLNGKWSFLWCYPSGTTAHVGISLYGLKKSGSHHLQRDGAFQRGSLDQFHVETDDNMGEVWKIRIWHDNTGTLCGHNYWTRPLQLFPVLFPQVYKIKHQASSAK